MGRMLARTHKRGLGRFSLKHSSRQKLKTPTSPEVRPTPKRSSKLGKKKLLRKRPKSKFVTPSESEEDECEKVK